MPPRSELLALLADCKENPEDDTLRLILADWLEEHGRPVDQARGEFIRCQVLYRQLPASDPRRNDTLRRSRSLLRQHGGDWLGPLSSWVTQWSGERGLLVISLLAESLTSAALTALCTEEPWAWVEDLQIRHLKPHELSRLVACPLLNTISSIRFTGGELGSQSATALAAMPWLKRIRLLDLTQQPITTRGLEALLRSPHLERLRSLQLPSTSLTPDAGTLLGSSPVARQLEHLNLWGNALVSQGVIGLASGLAASGEGRLQILELQSNVISNPGAVALARCPGLRHLRVLNLSDNAIGPEGALALAESPHLNALETLLLWGNPVGSSGADLLTQRFGSRAHVSPIGE